MRSIKRLAGALLCVAAVHAATAGDFSMQQVLSYPYPSELVASEQGGKVAWVENQRGLRNIWVAGAPDYAPRQVTHFDADDGQQLTNLAFSPDGDYLVFVRGGDHHENWPAQGNLAPNPASGTEQRYREVYAVALDGDKVVDIGHGDTPAVSAVAHKLAFTHPEDGSVWTAPIDGSGEPARLFFDRGKDRELEWSPDGKTLAFVSNREDHAFIGLFSGKDEPLRYLAPGTHADFFPRWSPDGKRIAFVRRPGEGGAPEPLLEPHPEPWAIWVADVASGKGHEAWASPETLMGSYPQTAGRANLHWGSGDRLVFLSDLDGWPHLYSVPAAGGEPTLLTPGDFMVEHVTMSPDHEWVVYNANTGDTSDDGDRRHLYRIRPGGGAPQALTAGETLEWSPVVPGDGKTVAFIKAGAKAPPLVNVMPLEGGKPRAVNADHLPGNFPTDELVIPKYVSFKSRDGWTIHGQLFQANDGGAPKPGVIFVHGGPPRQMLLGWHYSNYYSNSYAVNQYLANHGFVVLSVNYRLGIGYGYKFHHPENWGPTGAAEYRDVVAGAKYLQKLPGVNGGAIGIWGGSYGGFLTAMGLARDSDIFKAGVDMHGVHDWSYALAGGWLDLKRTRYQQHDWDRILEEAWKSSPDASIDDWKSPVLLIQGDDDRNVHFHQTVDLARRLNKAGVRYEEIVIPNEIHDFLRYESWLRADRATAAFLKQELGPN